MQLIRDKRTLKTAIHEYHEARRAGQASPVDFNALLSAFIAICQAIGYAHSRGVLHRDLKPQNVMLGRYGEAIVIDWGLAKFEAQTEASLTISANRRDRKRTRRRRLNPDRSWERRVFASGTSLWKARARGCSLGHLAAWEQFCSRSSSARPPHQHTKNKKITDLLKEIVEAPSPVARQVEPSVPAALDAICSKAMSKQLEDRYQKATTWRTTFAAGWLASRSRCNPEPWHDRLLRWLRKHRAAATSSPLPCWSSR